MDSIEHPTRGDEIQLVLQVQDLGQHSNPARARFISLTCSLVYGNLDAPAIDSYFVDCLALCSGSTERLFKVFLNKFFDGSSPLTWIICNLPSDSKDAPYAILDRIIKLFPSPLPKEVLEEIEVACCKRNDHNLYEKLQAHPAIRGPALGLSSTFPSPRVVVDGDAIFFLVPRFVDLMLVGEEWATRFIYSGRIFELQFQPVKWLLKLDCLKPLAGEGKTKWKWEVYLHDYTADPNEPSQLQIDDNKTPGEPTPKAGQKGAAWTWDPWVTHPTAELPGTVPIEGLRTRSKWVGTDRQISGKLVLIQDWQPPYTWTEYD